jgi:hypothetical protein
LKSLTADLKLALDPVRFAEMLQVEADPWQQTALRWKGKKLLMCCSRQAGKSTISAILALHRILFVPGSLVLLVSPSQRQSSELFKKVSEFIKLLPVQLEKIEDNKLSVQLKSGSRVVSLPSTEATIRGYSGASLIIVDEAARLPDHIFFSISPMVAVSQGQMILLSTPAGKRGFFHDAYISEGNEWEKITVTADQCPRISAEFLEKERTQIGDFYFRQEYLCEFLEPEGSLFTLEQINNCFTDDFDGWDISIKKGVILSE